jgi:hypothetical protein
MYVIKISFQDSLQNYYPSPKVMPTSSESLTELRTSGFGSGTKLSTISESSATHQQQQQQQQQQQLQQQQQQRNVGLDIEYLLNQATNGGGSNARSGHLVKVLSSTLTVN